MVHTCWWQISWCIKFYPREWRFINIQAPNVVDCLASSISREDEKIWFGKDNRMAISPTGCLTNNWDDHPLSQLITVPEIEKIQIVGGQTTTSSRATIDDHLEGVDSTRSVGSSWRRCDAGAIELLPLHCDHVEGVSVPSNYVLSCIASCTSKQNNL